MAQLRQKEVILLNFGTNPRTLTSFDNCVSLSLQLVPTSRAPIREVLFDILFRCLIPYECATKLSNANGASDIQTAHRDIKRYAPETRYDYQRTSNMSDILLRPFISPGIHMTLRAVSLARHSSELFQGRSLGTSRRLWLLLDAPKRSRTLQDAAGLPGTPVSRKRRRSTCSLRAGSFPMTLQVSSVSVPTLLAALVVV